MSEQNQPPPVASNWSEWRLLVLYQLEQQQKGLSKVSPKLAELDALIADLDKQISNLKVKAGLLGLIAGALPGLVALIYKLMET